LDNRIEQKKEDLILEGSITKVLLRLGLPVVASFLLQTAFNIIDAIWIGQLGEVALAAISAAGFVVWIVFSLSAMIAVGVTAIVARYVGAGDVDGAAHVAGQGIWLSLILSVALGVVGVSAAPSLFGFMGTTADVTADGMSYLTVLFWGIPILLLFFVLNAIYQGNGDTKTPMKLLAIAVIINGVLDPFLIFGWGPFPKLGVVGAGLATVIGRLVGVVLGFKILLRRQAWIRWRITSGEAIDLSLMWRILRIGLPASITGMLGSTTWILLTQITTQFGTTSVAALGAGHKIQTITYMLGMGMAAAVTTIVGQNLGAGQPNRATRVAWMGCGIIALVNGAMAVIYLTLSPAMVRIFIADLEVVRIGSNYLKIIAVTEIFMGIESVLDGAFGGAGDTIPPTVIAVPLTLARYPLSYYFALILWNSINGVWVAIATTGILRGFLIMFWFHRGKWKECKV